MKKVLMTLYALSGLVFNYLPSSFLSPYFAGSSGVSWEEWWTYDGISGKSKLTSSS